MPKKPHPVDIRDAERIENAAYFNVHSRADGQKFNHQAVTLAEAVALHDQRKDLGCRVVLIYAIGADGSSPHVSNEIAQAARS